MNDLPELPFKQILSYLSVEERLMARSVSRSWRQKFDFQVKSLFFSKVPRGFIVEQRGMISGPFATNFISSPRFESFFSTFRVSVLCNLKGLRLCKLDVNKSNGTAFAQVLNSFEQLEELGLFRFAEQSTEQRAEIKLKLPMLQNIHLEDLEGSFQKLTIDSPKLHKIRVDLKVDLVHGDSVKELEVEYPDCVEIERLINLEVLHSLCHWSRGTKSTLLDDLKNLKEIWLGFKSVPGDEGESILPHVVDLFEQKEKYNRADLKIYLCGLLLNGPDPSIAFFRYDEFLSVKNFNYLKENEQRVAERIQLLNTLVYSPDMDPNLVGKFVDLDCLLVPEEIADVSKFLKFLEIFPQISCIDFAGEQPPELFCDLSKHSAVQWLQICRAQRNSRFLLSLKHLVHLALKYSVGLGFVQEVFDELPFLISFEFKHNGKQVTIERRRLNKFRVLNDQWEAIFSGTSLTAAIEFIRQLNKRKFAKLCE